MKSKTEKNIILNIGTLVDNAVFSIREYEKKTGKKFRLALAYDISDKTKAKTENVDIFIPIDFSSKKDISLKLDPYKKSIVAVTCRNESSMIFFRNTIPFLRNLNVPSVESIDNSINKIKMRKKLRAYDGKISPNFMLVKDCKKSTLKTIKDKIGYPLVVKPAGLAASLLVSMCFYQEELEKTLKFIFSESDKIYKKLNNKKKPEILVEEFMEGEMYSVDVYIDKNKKVYFCPFTHTKNGRSVGFDDFFEYQMITPTNLSIDSIKKAKEVAIKAIRAVDLFNSSAHIELLKTEKGWKIIEIGARIGGWRNQVYSYSYGINHAMNDILNKMGRKPVLMKKVLAHTAVLQFYARKEGVLRRVLGLKKVRELESFKKMKQNIEIGEKSLFTKNGGKPTLYITLSNKNREDLLGDIRRAEQSIVIEVD